MTGWIRGTRKLPVGEELRAEVGSPHPIRRLASSPRSRVWLVELDGSPAIVKQVVGRSDAADRYAREVTALRLAARVRPPVVPALLGTDPHARVLVLEYVPARSTANDWVVPWATGLAHLHAATGPADANALPRWRGPTSADIQAFIGFATTLGVPVPPGVPDELERLLDRLDRRPGHHALLHGDPCPDNSLRTAGETLFIDLEQAGLGNGLVELAYLRMGFPTCWCVTAVSEPLRVQAEIAYHSTYRSVTGTDPTGDLTDACAGWLIRGDALVPRARRTRADHLAHLTRKNWHWGTATARQRLTHRLAAVATMTTGSPDLPELHQLTATLHDQIRRRWPRTKPLPATGTGA